MSTVRLPREMDRGHGCWESLVADPRATPEAVCAFVGALMGAHDPHDIEPCCDMVEFDQRPGTPGLHDPGRQVQAQARVSILPPDLFPRRAVTEFRDDPTSLPSDFRAV